MDKVLKHEIDQRTAGFQTLLQERHLDGAFILQNADLYYFSGTIQTSVLFIPRTGEPVLMVHKSLQRAREESPLGKVVPAKGRGGIAEALKGAGISRLGHVGMEMDVIPAALYLWYVDTFPACRFEDVSEEIRRLRMLKSSYEVDQIRKATRILHKGFEGIQSILREGMTELEVDGHLSLIARREGHMGILRMRGWNQEMTYAHVLSGENGSVVSFLNSYFERCSFLVFEGRGHINKYTGDGFLAIFGAPEPLENHAFQAFTTACRLLELTRDFILAGQPMGVGIGIYTGRAILGNIGSQTKIEYTAIGDTVNSAARLQEFTRHFNEYPIIMGREVWENLTDHPYYASIRNLGSLKVRGKKEGVDAFGFNFFKDESADTESQEEGLTPLQRIKGV